MSMPTFYWWSEYEYAGGGKKAARPQNGGFLTVETSGGISVEPDDDYYGGSISPDEALKLAKCIIAAHEAKKMIRFRVIVACYRAQENVEETIRSVLSQKGDFGLLLDFTDDASPDETIVRAMRAARDFPEGEHRFEHNIVRVGGLANFHAAILRADPDEILLFMGGDGDTINEGALARVAALFEDPALWMTYGTFKNSDGTNTHKWEESKARGICPWQGAELRDEIHPFLWMPLCVRAKIAKKVFPHSLKLQGFYFPSSGDVALNIPIAEMCGPEHARYIEEEWYTRKCHARNDTRLDAMLQMFCAWKALGKQRYKRLPNIDAEPELEDHQLKWGLMCHPDGLANRTMPQAIQYEEESLPVVGYRDGPPMTVDDLPPWIGELAKKSLACPKCKGQRQCMHDTIEPCGPSSSERSGSETTFG